jgi:hypothetical protein
VLDPIARRAERELAEMRSLLPDLVSSEVAQRLNAQSDRISQRLSEGGALAAYEELKNLVDALSAIVSPESSSKASTLAPLDAARARLLDDVLQIARFTEVAQREQVSQKAAQEKPEDKGPVTTTGQPPSTGTGAAAAMAPTLTPSATPPPVVPSPPPIAVPPPPKPVERPKDPLFTHWEQTDLIGISASVNNLARYISHEGLVPPVAIGVFGDWGSGKTFFIRALQSQIALLSSQSRDALAATPSQTTVFCSHIVQIEFNAWHFVESNLWASLAAHIFDRLYAELERRSREESGNSNVDGLYQQFSAYKQAVAEQKRLSELVKTLAAKREEANSKKLAAEKSLQTRLAALTNVVAKHLGDLVTQRLDDDDRKRLDELVKVSNLKELDAAAAEAAAVAKEGQTFVGRLRLELSWWGGRQLSLFIIIIAGVVFGLPRLLPLIFDVQAHTLERIATLIGGYAAAATAALSWLSSGGRKLVRSAQKVEGVLSEVRTRVESTPNPELDAAKRALETAESDLIVIDQQIKEQRDRLSELADELDPNQLGTRLQAFLEARVKSDTYQRHLGLISLVRKDFSSLYDLMQVYWKNRKQAGPEVLAEVRDALGQTSRTQVPFIERIVLYIDDLDRCPEEKVVDVLQAVHLMLGLPLFVVVVAVDVRWVGQSIRKHYGRLVGWDAENGEHKERSASADDYLEKIFQIPYRIHPIDPEVRKLLLGGLLRQPYLSAAGPAAQEPAVIQQSLVPKELSLYPQELKTIEELYRSVGSSPRRVRRFLDVYRLMRSGMEEADVQDLISNGHYALILALFALLSGAPVSGPRIIELLRREALRPAMDPNSDFATKSLGNWIPVALKEDSLSEDERVVIDNAMAYIDGLASNKLALLVTLRRWIPEIARYSFREVRMQEI